jgi:biopolymer transport protein ExbB/TolQ
MELIHYLIVIPLILVIVFFQLRVFLQANNKIDVFRSIFPGSKHAYLISKANIVVGEKENKDDLPEAEPESVWQEDTEGGIDSYFRVVEVSQISVQRNNPTMNNIVDALNMYLQKNNGAISDFALMKDVVERYCGAEEEEITVMQPIPLYMGLMGTMIGIIVGIGVIAANDGVAQLTNVSSMMSCVAIAMVASLVGIVFTTIISWRSKGAKTQVESRKNEFYSWLQTELLPVLSGNTVTALSLLQANLMTFNQTFKGNIKEFDNVLANVRQVSRDQADALDAISRIDINRVAQANVTVLRELQRSTGQLERFNQYLAQVNGYLDAVNALNTNLNNHLDRTAAIERMGVFFEREIEQVQSREEHLRGVVGSIDRSLEQSFNQMVSAMNTYFAELRNQSGAELNTVRDAYEQQHLAFVRKLQEEQETVSAKTEELNRKLQELQSISETKQAFDTLTNVTRENSRKLEQITRALTLMGGPTSSSLSGGESRDSRIQGIINNSIKIAALIAFIMFAIQFIANLIVK